jgi:hypothetical protein
MPITVSACTARLYCLPVPQVEEVVGIITIEDVLEELLQVRLPSQISISAAPLSGGGWGRGCGCGCSGGGLLAWLAHPTAGKPQTRVRSTAAALVWSAFPCLQTEIIDETDQFEDNLQTVQATPQVGWVWGVEAGTAAVKR